MYRAICLLTMCFFLLKHGSAQQYGSFKDSRDGRVYKTVKIRGKEWMIENLNTIKFRNGDYATYISLEQDDGSMCEFSSGYIDVSDTLIDQRVKFIVVREWNNYFEKCKALK
jgi:hypothetical protein